MITIVFTLIADGTSDRALIPIMEWLIQNLHPDTSYVIHFANELPPPSTGLATRINHAVRLYPCDILLIHRDAEKEKTSVRISEIESATKDRSELCVPIIPIRMTESWLLFDEAAIRMASGNPNGNNRLELPSLSQVERASDPKALLFDALKTASGKTGRRLMAFSPHRERARVAELIDDFSPLEKLESFRECKEALFRAINEHKNRALVPPI